MVTRFPGKATKPAYLAINRLLLFENKIMMVKKKFVATNLDRLVLPGLLNKNEASIKSRHGNAGEERPGAGWPLVSRPPSESSE